MMCRCNLIFSSKNKAQGFTLLEVLIAITLLSFVMITVVSVTTDSTNLKDRIIGEDRENLQIETAMARLEWDFSQIYSPLYFSRRYQKPFVAQGQDSSATDAASAAINARFNGNERFAFPNQDGLPVPKFEAPDKSTFIFFTTSNRRKRVNAKESNFAWVKYTLEAPTGESEDGTESKGDDLVRYFMTTDPFNGEAIDFTKIKAHVLLNNVKKLEFLYWDPARKQFSDSLSVIKDGQHLIRGLQVKITWIDANDVEREEIKILRPLFPFFVPEDLNKIMQELSGQKAAGTDDENSDGDEEQDDT
ncbi:MAG: prepilin-type N-terminal cleavage/methylation domain-containing protein [Bacteriovoracaceae bacterium]|nr:prepilin-type N-terminal cleavage/methylation domain-containing protein [Bacteriovoracaceae bacterium]